MLEKHKFLYFKRMFTLKEQRYFVFKENLLLLIFEKMINKGNKKFRYFCLYESKEKIVFFKVLFASLLFMYPLAHGI